MLLIRFNPVLVVIISVVACLPLTSTAETAALVTAKCPDGFELQLSQTSDGSFTCKPKGVESRQPEQGVAAPQEDAARALVQQTMVAFGQDHDVARAAAGYAKALERSPGYPPAQFGLGIMLEAQGEWVKARSIFGQLASNTRAGVFAPRAKEEVSRIDTSLKLEATADGRKVIQYDTLIAQARMMLAAGQGAAATERAAAAQKLDGTRWQAYAIAGEIAQTMGLSQEAVRFFQAAHARTSDDRVRSKLMTAVDAARIVKTLRDCSNCPEMVVIPPGSFVMGSPVSELNRSDNEGPRHVVSIPQAFAAGKFEVTMEEWNACVKKGACARKDFDVCVRRGACSRQATRDKSDGRLPVSNVSWNEAKRYIQWLSRQTGKNYRLLSEAEWEYAARAGSTVTFAFGDNIAPQQANYQTGFALRDGGPTAPEKGGTVPVGSYPPNAFGLHDVHGNVSEWTEDCWNPTYNGAPSNGSAWNSGDCSAHPLRGGSWMDYPWLVRVAVRKQFLAANRFSLYSGFRVARTLP